MFLQYLESIFCDTVWYLNSCEGYFEHYFHQKDTHIYKLIFLLKKKLIILFLRVILRIPKYLLKLFLNYT